MKEKIIECLKMFIENNEITQEELFPVSIESAGPLYTILSFKHNRGLMYNVNEPPLPVFYTIDDNNRYYHTGAHWALKSMLEDETMSIYSVRRNSDNTVYTIGDWIQPADIDTNNKPFQIDNFQLGVQNDIWANPKGNTGYSHISKWQKIDTFVTEDGVTITEKDYPIWICQDIDGTTWIKLTNRYSPCKAHYKEEGPLADGKYKIFSTEEAADKWIAEQKSLFTTVDGANITDQDQCMWAVAVEDIYDIIDRMPYYCVNDHAKATYHWFSNKEARTQWIADKTKKVPLITEDGVEITDPEQEIYGIYIDDFRSYNIPASEYKELYLAPEEGDEDRRGFSTEAARDEYIARNKRLFSIEDIAEWHKRNQGAVFSDLYRIAKERIKEIS